MAGMDGTLDKLQQKNGWRGWHAGQITVQNGWRGWHAGKITVKNSWRGWHAGQITLKKGSADGMLDKLQ